MNDEAIRERCEEMTLKELLRATTSDRNEYDPAFTELAESILNLRWMEVQELRNNALVQIQTEAPEFHNREDAVKILETRLDRWQSLTITNSLDDMIILQRERKGWTGHLMVHDEYEGSFQLPFDLAPPLVTRFIELDYHAFKSVSMFDISSMAILLETESEEFATITTERLESKNIDYTVQTRVIARLFQDEESSVHGLSFIVLVQATDFDDAREILDEINSLIASLHDEAERYAEEENRTAEMETYRKIIRMVPNDHIAIFNLGTVFFELDHYEDAIEQFARVLILEGVKAADDVEEYCVEILSRMPGNIRVLHVLADIERLRANPEEALAYIEQILNIDAEDAIAHMNLGYLLYEESDDDSEARRHLRRYLELKPDAEDRGTIEAMISELM